MNTCKIENCNEKCFEKETKCILHSDNKTKDITEFWKKINEVIQKQKKDVLLVNISFKNVFFPKKKNVGLAESLSSPDSDDESFRSWKDTSFTKKFTLNKCTFWEDVDFKFITFEKGLTFENCTFEKKLSFKNKTFNEGAKVRIQTCPKIQSINFENTTFKDLADFYGSHFNEVNFFKTTFEDISVFTEVVFHEAVNFKYTIFEQLALFRKTTFKKTIDLEDSIIKEEANFLDITSEKREKDKNGKYTTILKDVDVKNRETARIIKNSFEKENNIIEANKFYALELKKRTEELDTENFLDFIIFKMHSISSEHSQSWLLSLLWILLIGWSFSCSQLNDNYWILIIFTLPFILINWLLTSCFDKDYLVKVIIRVVYSGMAFFIINYMLINCCINTISSKIATNLYPFSGIGNTISLSELSVKVILAYLFYQFIVSVRQNTRRK